MIPNADVNYGAACFIKKKTTKKQTKKQQEIFESQRIRAVFVVRIRKFSVLG